MDHDESGGLRIPLIDPSTVDTDSSSFNDNGNNQIESLSSSTITAHSNDAMDNVVVVDDGDENGYVKRYFFRRLYGEYILIRRYGIWMLIMLGYLIYFPLTVFRNVAYYRFRAGERLKDLGYELLGESGDKSVVAFLNLFPMNLVLLAAIALCISTLFRFPNVSTMLTSSLANSNDADHITRVQVNNFDVSSSIIGSDQDASESAISSSPIIKKRKEKPYIVNMLKRALMMILVGHTLRFFTYSVTSLPGTARHCLPGNFEHTDPPQPKNIHDIFTRYAHSPGQNCGDLMFSGHMLQIMTPVLTFRKYGIDAFDTILQPKTVKIIEYFLWFLVVVQAFFIVSLRNHYTSDVVVGAYVTPLLWHFANDLIFPDDAVV